MTEKISLTGADGKTLVFDPANIRLAACWDSGQLNIFWREGEEYASMLHFAPGEERAQMEVIAAAMEAEGVTALPLQNKTEGYQFLYRADSIAFYKLAENKLTIEDVPFTLEPNEADHVRGVLGSDNPEKWLTFSPDAPWPLTSTDAVYAVRKSEAAMVTGYLLGNVIIDMHDRARLFIKVAEDRERRQADEVGTLFKDFVTVQGPQSAAHLHPRYFNEGSTYVTQVDFSSPPTGLLVQDNDWHVPFRTVADAQAALEKLRRDVAEALAVPAPVAPKPAP